MKKGFTLVEVIVVISLIGVICLTSFISYAKVSNASIESEYNTLINKFITASSVYIDNDENLRTSLYNDDNGIKVTLESLKNEGLIKGNIENPITKEKINYKSYVMYFKDIDKCKFVLVK